jgi:hypothetical protein
MKKRIFLLCGIFGKTAERNLLHKNYEEYKEYLRILHFKTEKIKA